MPVEFLRNRAGPARSPEALAQPPTPEKLRLGRALICSDCQMENSGGGMPSSLLFRGESSWAPPKTLWSPMKRWFAW